MGYFLIITGIVGIPICLVILIIRAIGKKKLKPTVMAMAGLLVCFIVGVSIVPSEAPEAEVANVTGPRVEAGRQMQQKPDEAEQEQIEPEPDVKPPTKEEISKSLTTASYKDLLRTPDEYVEQYVTTTVKVSQVLNGGWLDNNIYYFGYTDNGGYGLYFDDKYCLLDKRFDDTTKLLESDILKIYGRFVGLKTFKTALTNTGSELPCVEMLYVEILEE